MAKVDCKNCPYSYAEENRGGTDYDLCRLDRSIRVRWDESHHCRASTETLKANPHADTLFAEELRHREEIEQRRIEAERMRKQREEQRQRKLQPIKDALQPIIDRVGKDLVVEALEDMP